MKDEFLLIAIVAAIVIVVVLGLVANVILAPSDGSKRASSFDVVCEPHHGRSVALGAGLFPFATARARRPHRGGGAGAVGAAGTLLIAEVIVRRHRRLPMRRLSVGAHRTHHATRPSLGSASLSLSPPSSHPPSPYALSSCSQEGVRVTVSQGNEQGRGKRTGRQHHWIRWYVLRVVLRRCCCALAGAARGCALLLE